MRTDLVGVIVVELQSNLSSFLRLQKLSSCKIQGSTPPLPSPSSLALPFYPMTPLLPSHRPSLRGRTHLLRLVNPSFREPVTSPLHHTPFESRRDLRPPPRPVAVLLKLPMMATWFDVTVIDEECDDDQEKGDAEAEGVCEGAVAVGGGGGGGVVRGGGDCGGGRERKGRDWR